VVGVVCFFFFFFQAEDGIRDRTVTGVQTCALPILSSFRREGQRSGGAEKFDRRNEDEIGQDATSHHERGDTRTDDVTDTEERGKIGRASCRERVEMSVGAGAVKKKSRKKIDREIGK